MKGNLIATLLKMDMIDMKMLKHGGLIKKMWNSEWIFTASLIDVYFGKATTLSHFFCFV